MTGVMGYVRYFIVTFIKRSIRRVWDAQGHTMRNVTRPLTRPASTASRSTVNLLLDEVFYHARVYNNARVGLHDNILPQYQSDYEEDLGMCRAKLEWAIAAYNVERRTTNLNKSESSD